MKRHVLFVASVATHIWNFHMPYLDYFQKEGFTVHIACQLNCRKELFEEKDILVHEIPLTRSAFALKNIWQAGNLLKRIFQQYNFALIHVHTPIISFLTRMVAVFASGAPILYTAHGFHFYKGAPWLNWLIYFPAEFIARFWTSALIVINREDYRNAIELLWYRNVFLVEGVGVDLREWKDTAIPKTNFLQREVRGCVFCCVAEMIPRKNHGVLLAAWEELQKRGVAGELWLLGDGEMEVALQEYVQERNLSDVYFWGYRQDVREFVESSDVLILVSLQEGLPRAIMEAMALGKPIIASDIRGNHDLVRHEHTGLLVSVNDPLSLADAMQKLAEKSELRCQMGKEGRAAIQPYALEPVLEKMKKIYQRFL
ncbi:glycosyltransferase family 4 protein [uncultured Anaeromusa sp.]|uniref:glycosyltransferase family 4 protein n=1 Tax=uncultured Anaeromusa sp. TaxID=673273 RepID=UPI0029C6CB2D|nr:glycosyltransferase family 4 protein [uncultured Anaeromusa sp.]